MHLAPPGATIAGIAGGRTKMWKRRLESLLSAPGAVALLALIGLARAIHGAVMIFDLRVAPNVGPDRTAAWVDVALILGAGLYFAVATLRMSRWPMVMASVWVALLLMQPFLMGVDPYNGIDIYHLTPVDVTLMRLGFLAVGWAILWVYRRRFNWSLLGVDRRNPGGVARVG